MKQTQIIVYMIILVLLCTFASAAATGDNLCLNAEVIATSGYVNEEETPKHMLDGDINTKWCSDYYPEKVLEIYTNGSTNPELIKHVVVLDFGEKKYFNKYAVIHASLCERDFDIMEFNAMDWILEASLDGTVWTVIDEVTKNSNDLTEREIPLTEARYVRLLILRPTQNESTIVRIPELKIFESDSLGSKVESEELEEIKRIEDESELAEAQEKAQEKLVLILIIIGMAISLCTLYVLKYVAYRKEKGAKS